jgi:hypothetical protein
MKTNELSGAALDWAVAKCEGVTCAVWQGMVVDAFSNPLMYHDDWAAGGPIIEREKIATRFDFEEQEWQATIAAEDEWVYGWGTTPLVAAMRCYVASKLGNEVQLPEGL